MHAHAMKTLGILTVFTLFSGVGNYLTAQSSYSITDLGVVSGRTFSNATGLNDNGQVVGVSSGGGIGGSVGFVWDSVNGMVGLEGFRTVNDSNIALGINDSGQIIGMSSRDAGDEHAIMWGFAHGLRAVLSATAAVFG